jgi:hypothetical protein
MRKILGIFILALIVSAGLHAQVTMSGGVQVGAPNSDSYPGVTSDGANGLAVTGGVAAATVSASVNGVFNVKTYGAVGDGVANDCAAIGAAITAHDLAGRGEIYFPAGTYSVGSSCHLTLADQTTISGVGKCSYYNDACGSVISSTDSTGVLFTVTANVALFKNIALTNTAVSPTAGAAIFTNGAQAGQMVDYDSIWVSGFYDNVHVGVGAEWSMRTSYLKNFVRYGLYVQNTVNADAGDWYAGGNYIEGGTKSTTGSASIYYTSGGGGKIEGNKLLGSGYADYGLLMDFTGAVSGQTVVTGNSIEQQKKEAIYIPYPWPYITISNNYLWGANSYSCIKTLSTIQQTYIGGGTCVEGGVGVSVYAVSVSSMADSIIDPFAWNGFLGPFQLTGSSLRSANNSSLPNLNLDSSDPVQIGNLASASGYWFNILSTSEYMQTFNSYYDHTAAAYRSTQTNASVWDTTSGGFSYSWDKSLTAGNTFTPTNRWLMDSYGQMAFTPSGSASGFYFSRASDTDLFLGINSYWDPNTVQHIAKATSAATIEDNAGTVVITASTGLTPGSPYTRTTVATLASTGASIPGLSINSGITMTANHGTGTSVQHSDGTGTSGHLAAFDGSGNIVEGGSMVNCGTTTTCSNTLQAAPLKWIEGKVTLAGGTATVTGVPAYTSTSSGFCSCEDTTAPLQACEAHLATTTSVVANGNTTDTVEYSCRGN